MAFSGHHARKRFGQHWLKDEAVLQRIVSAAELGPDDHVLEVGPGRGALTAQLIASPAASVQAVELDRDLVDGLNHRFQGECRFQLQSGDVLALPQLGDPDRRPTKVVANIPYNITGPLLERLVGRLDGPVDPPYQRLVLLVQQEVARRISARAGQSSFSALSVRMQLLAHCQSVCPVPPRCFQPPPKVQSEVISLDPRPVDQRLPHKQAKQLEQLLRLAFGARRKMVRNTLASAAPDAGLEPWLEQAGVTPQQRPQEIAPEQWVALAAALQPAL